MELELPYGRAPIRVEVGDRDIEVIRPVALPPPRPLDTLLDDALAAPIHASPLASLAPSGARVTVIVSDSTRAEPRAAFLAAIRRHISDVRWTLAVATGTHGPCRVDQLGLDLRDMTVVNHDGHRSDDLVTLGATAYGTPTRVHRCVVDADLVIATGCIRPHYFAGFGAGAKAIFPGLGAATAIRFNHRLKTHAAARAGIVDGNPCRADLEEAVRFVRAPTFLLDGVCGPDDAIHGAVAGDLERAFRAGAELARPWFTVRTSRAPVVIASDALPVTASLYQAAKIAAAAATLVEPGGVLIVAAECPDGVGPLETVNEAILRIGILPRLPANARLVLVSGLSPDVVRTTLVEYARDVASVLASHPGRVVVIPRASQLLCEPC
jgi:nickel-dependent lactate racemase